MNIRAGLTAMLCIALASIGASFYMLQAVNTDLKIELATIQQRFETMSIEHRKAIEAADMALKARSMIHEQQTEKAARLEQALSLCPDMDGIDVPDDVRLFLNEACSRGISASGGTSYGY